MPPSRCRRAGCGQQSRTPKSPRASGSRPSRPLAGGRLAQNARADPPLLPETEMGHTDPMSREQRPLVAQPHASSQSPLSYASRPFTRPIFKARCGSRLCENSDVVRATSKFRGLSPRRARKIAKIRALRGRRNRSPSFRTASVGLTHSCVVVNDRCCAPVRRSNRATRFAVLG